MAQGFNWGGAIGGALQAGASPHVRETFTNFEQLKKEDKVAKALFDALIPDKDPLSGEVPAHPMRIQKKQFDTMSARDRIAATQGYMKATALQEATQELQMKREAIKRMVEQDDALKKEFGASASHPRFAEVMNALRLSSPDAPESFMPQPFNIGGIEGVVNPKTGAMMEKRDRGEMTQNQKATLALKLSEQIRDAARELSDTESMTKLDIQGKGKGTFDQYFQSRLQARKDALEQAVEEYETLTGKKYKAKKDEPAAPSTGRITIKSIRQK